MSTDLVNVPPAPTVNGNGNDAAPPSVPAPRTIVTNGRQLADLLTETLEAGQAANIRAKKRPVLYVRGGQLARVVEDEDGRPAIAMVDDGALMGILATITRWETVTAAKEAGQPPKRTSSFPPAALVRAFLSLGNWPGLPPLAGLVHAPFFDAEGNLHAEPGYNRATGLYNAATLALGDTTPTTENVAAARALLLEDLLGDFPFENEASRAHALALLILPFLRPMIAGATPLHAIDAPSPGTGKSLLADVCATVATGQGSAAMAAGRDDDEWRKRLVSALMTGASHITIDNVTAALDSGALSSALTAGEVTDRLLGSNRMVRILVRCVWAVTANNLTPSGEIARRMVWIRLDANAERPWQREGFKHSNLKTWATENRAKLAGAAVTLIRHWIAEGMKPFTERRKGSYEAWARTVGGVLQAAGIPGFLANDDDLYETTVPDAGAWRAFVEAWHKEFKTAATPTAELFRLASHNDDARKDAPQPAQLGTEAEPEPEYQNLLGDILGSGNRASRAAKLGKALHANAGRVFTTDQGTFKIARAGERRGKPRWNLVQLAAPKTPQNDAEGVEGARNPLPHPLPLANAATRVESPENAKNDDYSRKGVEGGRGCSTHPIRATQTPKTEKNAILAESANPLPPSTQATANGADVGLNGGAGAEPEPPAVPAVLAPYVGRALTVRELETALELAKAAGVPVDSKPGRGGWWIELK